MQEDGAFADPDGEAQQSESNRSPEVQLAAPSEQHAETNGEDGDLVEPRDPGAGRGVGVEHERERDH